ncbi:MAG: TldD/PmbA family protein [Chloroflexota bacterium]
MSPSTQRHTPDPTGESANPSVLRAQFAYLPDVIAELERSVPYASALATSSSGVRLALRDSEQGVSRRDPSAGVVLTASDGYEIEEVAVGATDEASVRDASRRLLEGLRRTRGGGRERNRVPLNLEPGDRLSADYVTPVVISPDSLSLAEKLARFEDLRQRARKIDSRVVQAMARYGDAVETKVFVNRARFITEVVHRATLNVTVFVSDGNARRYNWLSRGGTGGLESLEVDEGALANVTEIAVALLGAKPMEPGVYDSVVDPSVAGILAHEAFGHGVETDMFLKGRARGAHYIGKRVGSDLVTIVDDPTVPGANGTYYIDDEGQSASPTCIIRDGILLGGLSDLYSATRLGIARTANGRRESFERKPYARMSNTFFTPGTHSVEEVLASLDHGMYICQGANGMEDPKGWGIQVGAHFAREYRHGKPTGVLYAPVSITGYVPDVLGDVTMVANDFHLHPGGCGKGWKEYITVGDGGPHVRTRLQLA